MNSKQNSKLWQLFLFVSFIIILLFFFYPFWIGIVGSVKTPKQVIHSKVYLPAIPFDFSSYLTVFQILSNPLWISLRLGVYVTLITIILGILGGYSLSICEFKGRNFLLGICLFGIYIPPVTKMLPALKLSQWLGVYNTISGLGLVTGGMLMSTATIMYREFYSRIPTAFIEAAKVEGANHIDILRYIILPLSINPSISVFVMAFATGWNNYMMALVLTKGNISTRPVALSIATLQDLAMSKGDYGIMLAGGLLAALPPILLYVIFQRYVRIGCVRDSGSIEK